MREDACFRRAIEEVDSLFSPRAGWSLLELLTAATPGISLADPNIGHPATFAAQVGLTRWLAARGLRPSVVLGHSGGEVAAAVTAEAMSLVDAVTLVQAHADLMRAAEPGAMLHVTLSARELTPLLHGFAGLEIVASNAPQSVVVAGPPEAVQRLAERLTAAEVRHRSLEVNIPFHTQGVETALDAFRASIKAIVPRVPTIPIYSGWRGGLAQAGDFGCDFWVRHVREPVRFVDAVDALLSRGKTINCIEVSPHPALLQHVSAIAAASGRSVSVSATLHREAGDQALRELARGGDPGKLACASPQQVEAAIRDSLSALLETDSLVAGYEDRCWTDLGLSSVQTVALSRRLSETLGIRLPVTLAYRCPTPKALVSELCLPRRTDNPATNASPGNVPIAIIGLACRFPGGANDTGSFWSLLESGRDPIREIPPERWPADRYYNPDRSVPGKSVSRWGGFIEGQDLRDMDARLFRLTPKEASALDPQQRLLLEVTWEALENAGIPPLSMKGRRVAVFAGIATDDYKGANLYARDLETADPYLAVGSFDCTTAGRLSFFFGWQGANMAVDTACSSSLVALHLATQTLRTGECDLAVVAGVNAILTPHLYVHFSKAGTLSPTGRCRAFAEDADGYVRAEGCGVLLLAREVDAIADRRRVRARLLGSAVNQDGSSTGFSAPSGSAQIAVVSEAWQRAGVDGRLMGYLEAHGTGTPIGDPIELESLAEVLGNSRSPADPLPIGSLKSQVGHLEAAAGVAGVIKTVLALEHARLPGNLHLRQLNHRVDWSALPLRVVDKNHDWPTREGRRIAGVSSFGYSGTNVHVVLEGVAEPPSEIPARSAQVLVLTAPSAEALADLAASYATRLDGLDAAATADLIFSTHTGRQTFAQRLAIVGGSAADLAETLREWRAGGTENRAGRIRTGQGQASPLVFAYTGQGCQYPGMGRQLYAREPAFRAVLDRCESLLKELRGKGILDLMLDPAADPGALESTDQAQPAIFSIQCALTELWKAWGVRPDCVVGHSVGEFAAAVAAGALTLEEGLALVAERGRLMAAMPTNGAMAALPIGEAAAQAAISEEKGLVLAAVNGPNSTVLSGSRAGIERALKKLGNTGRQARWLKTSHAFHSPLMAPAAESFATAFRNVTVRRANLPWISTVDGRDAQKAPIDADYWCRQIVEPVRYADAIDRLEAKGCGTFLEIGPAAVLAALGAERANNHLWLPSLQRQQDDETSIASALAALAATGTAIDWSGYEKPWRRKRTDLPGFPFQRRRHWREPSLPATRMEVGPYERINAYALLRLLAVFQKCKLLDQEGGTWSLEQLAGALPARHPGQLEGCLALLESAGYLRREAAQVVALATVGAARAALGTLTAQRAAIVADHPTLEGTLALLDACLDDYPALLAGQRNPLEVLFPGGRFERVAAVYAGNEVQDRYNALTAAGLRELLLRHPPATALRILEIGAGTGSTTTAVLAALPAGSLVHYRFTDLGQAFIAQARRRHAGLGWMDFATLDIERPPEEQGFVAGEADVVIAANVLHATRDIAQSLRHVHWLLAPGGHLILNEQTVTQPFVHLIFGLTEGWWHFTDGSRRLPHSPLLGLAAWIEVLREAGFDASSDPHGDNEQTVLVAQAAATSFTAGSSAMPEHTPEAALQTVQLLIAELTGLDAQDIGSDTPLLDLGLDSLMLVELRSRLHKDHGFSPAMAEFYDGLETAAKIAARLASLTPPPAKATPLPVPADAPPANIPLPAAPAVTAGSIAGGGVEQLMALQLETLSRLMTEQLATLGRAAPAPNQIIPATPLATRSPEAAPVAQPPQTPNFRSLHLEDDPISDTQRAFIDNLTRRYIERTAKSRALAADHRTTLADWKNTLSFRYSLKEMMYPIAAERSKGAHFTDIDGNEFLDITMGCGIALLGHSPDCVVQAIHAQTDKHYAIGPQTAQAADVAAVFSRLTGMERVTFCNTGAEAVMMALRIARAVTGRRKAAIFAGAYHGTWDGVLGIDHDGQVWPIAAGIPPGMVEDLLILNYGTDEALATLREQGEELAAVLVEPVQSRRPGLQPKEFLLQLRQLTEASGAVLIFDEMITGFRIHPGGAQAWFGVRADLATYGKIAGGGLPLSAVAGSARLMDTVDGGPWNYGDTSRPRGDVIYFGGTYVKHPLALAAAKATLDYLELAGAPAYDALNRRSEHLAETLNQWFAAEAVPMQISHFGSLFRFEGTGRFSAMMQPLEMELFFLLLIKRGIYVWERRVCFLSMAHSDEDVDRLVTTTQEAVAELRSGGFPFLAQPGSGISLSRADDAQGPASAAQRRLFALSQMEGGTVYNVPLALDIRGALDISALEKFFNTLAVRHEALRTRFLVEGDVVVQRVEPTARVTIERFDCAATALIERVEAFVRPFDLGTAPIFRVGLFTVAPDHHALVMDAHHIVVDGLSLNIVAREFMAFYSGRALPKLPARPLDYPAAEAQYLASAACRQDAKFWHERFADLPPVLNLPTDKTRPARSRHRGADLTARVDAHTTTALQAAARACRLPLFPLLLALYQVLLYRLTGQDDLVIGLPVGGRDDSRFRDVIGMFANTLPLRLGLDNRQTLAEHARRCHREFLADIEHQSYPLEQLIAGLDLPRDLSRNPLFDTMFIFEDGNDRVYRVEGLQCRPLPISRHAAMFDLAMEVIAAEGCLELRCEYDSDLFELATIQAFLDLYRRLLTLASEGVDTPIYALDLAGEEQSHLLQWGDGGLAPVSRGTILELFAAQVAARPEALALVASDGQFTYRQLDQAANRLAHTLLARCPLATNDRVALVAERDSLLLVGLLAILKTGAAYVPVDPDFPPERVRVMLADSGCRLVLAAPSLLADIASPVPVLSLTAASATAPATAPDSHSGPDALAYVIFTSGSTGRPKGAQLLQRNAAAFFSALPGAFGFTPQSRILALTTISFDIAGLELLGALCCGMTVVLATTAQARDPAQVFALVAAENIQVLQLTPTRLKLLLEEGDLSSLASVQTLLVGGEALPRHLAERLACLPAIRAFNVYGPSETTIWSAAQLLTGGPVSLGRALPGERLFVLSAEHRLQPVGAVGEIAIAGDGVGSGYLDQPEKTAERFVSIPALASGPVYLTGDLGRWRPDGSLEFLGRLDHQIKIRGTRVEPGEVEHHLRRENGIDDALVIARKAPDGETELIAYLVSHDPAVRVLDTAFWRTRLALTLPDAMIPARFTVLDALPQTPNGKIDRRALPNPDLLVNPLPSRAPANPIELAIITAFASVLHQHVGPEDDYFAHGGDSIRALGVVARLREAGYGLKLEDLFHWPTAASLALHVWPLGVGSDVDKPSSPPVSAPPAILDHEEIDELFA